MTDDIPLIERLRAWKSLRACDFEENSPLAEDLEAAAQALLGIRAKTIEECISLFTADDYEGAGMLFEDIVGRIRALNQPPEAGEQCRCSEGAAFVKTGAAER